ncbi:MAG: NAD-dependent succinate-semialdehyde dehydrogenase [Actinobacteria bacterium]|jgi:succinate-semialdehyde dehydrogenase/glutarate-semialdehyde dehydrogenase|nr:NAD-dependent succinate-semialdehyde dehydrogenase [Actinomycetota bacterium]MCL6095396.1 NAD-dependent succinate-semialdehyde dehydrogenase [Actinomycetota bacterium]
MSTAEKIESVNPASGEIERSFSPLSDSLLEGRIALAASAFKFYKTTSFEQRASWMARAADLMESEREALARIATTEMGKTIASARAEVDKCARTMRYFAEHASDFLADEPVSTTASSSYVTYQPLGPILAIMPWNFPYWQVVRFAAPALMAGNVALLKHAPNVPQTALAIEDLFVRAGFEEGVFQSLLIEAERTQGILADDRVAAVTLTGSDRAGKIVATSAAKNLKKAVLELGGSDPFIVMPSANLDRAVEIGVMARVQNNGQSCIAAKRFIVHESVAREFEEKFIARMASLVVDDPMEEETDVGPLVSDRARQLLLGQVEDALNKGAELLFGGMVPERPGFYYQPAVVRGIKPEMRMYREEVFGPVAAIYEVPNLEEAITLANDNPYGLGSSVWTEDEEERKRCIQDLDAGQVFFNAMVASTPELPFGGVKQSGYGRELSAHGIREFTNQKTVWIA